MGAGDYIANRSRSVRVGAREAVLRPPGAMALPRPTERALLDAQLRLDRKRTLATGRPVRDLDRNGIPHSPGAMPFQRPSMSGSSQ
jgi:hypothetical protein